MPNPCKPTAARRMLKSVRRFFGSDDGPTAVEYSVLLALILLTCVSGARTLGCSVNDSMTKAAEKLGN